MNVITESKGMVTLTIKIVPRARKNQIAGIEGDALKIRLNAPPVEGKANDALVEFLAKTLGIARAQIEIVAGHTARRKIVRVRGISAREVEARMK
jgi:uncharacterized protein (TIGR00251 family)